jgi:ubiquinone/menaquinone biosynthesis C-methylase UbiE
MTHPLGYVEPRYLEAIGEYLRPLKERSYAAMNIQLGHHVLDSGSGTGIDTLALARLVGPLGRVVGVDFDPDMVAAARARAERANIDGWVEHITGDVTSLPFEDGTFHASRCDRLFQVLPDPSQALAEMVRVTRRGGWVVAIDTDWGTLSIHTDEVELERKLARVQAESVRPNGYIGRQLYGLFNSHGLTDVSVEMVTNIASDYAGARIGYGLDRLERAALQMGALTAEELKRLRESFERADSRGAFFSSVGMMLAVGRKA